MEIMKILKEKGKAKINFIKIILVTNLYIYREENIWSCQEYYMKKGDWPRLEHLKLFEDKLWIPDKATIPLFEKNIEKWH